MKTEKWLSSRLRFGEVWRRTTCFSFEHAGAPGVPDLYCVSRLAAPFWIELKVVAGHGCLIPFRDGQPAWLDAHEAEGGRAYILVWVEASRSLVLLSARRVRVLARLKLEAAEAWKIGEERVSGPESWAKVEDMCLGQPTHKLQQTARSSKRTGEPI